MSAYEDAFIAEAEALSNKLIAEGDARLASATARLSHCHKRVKKTEGIHRNDQEHFRKAELALEKHKVSIVAPHILAAYERLPSVELKLKIAEFEHQRKTDEYQRLQAKHLDASKSEIRLKKANKQLTNTVETLTAQLEGKSSPQEQTLQNENDELKKKLDLLQAQLDSKTKECDAKDQAVEDLREDFGAYQSVYEDTWSHRHDGCNELAAALEEQCEVLQSNFEALQGINNTLEGNLNTLHHKLNSAAKERDNLQERYKVSDCGSQMSFSHQLTLPGIDQGSQDGAGGP
jgi:chromosome segregation ATPase